MIKCDKLFQFLFKKFIIFRITKAHFSSPIYQAKYIFLEKTPKKSIVLRLVLFLKPFFGEQNVWKIQWQHCCNLHRYLSIGEYFLCLSTPFHDRDMACRRGDWSRSNTSCKGFRCKLPWIHRRINIDLCEWSRWTEKLFFRLTCGSNMYIY